MKGLDRHKALGPEGISPSVLRECRGTLVKPLVTCFRISLNENKVYPEWKRANVEPILKKSDTEVTLNYRPVSLMTMNLQDEIY